MSRNTTSLTRAKTGETLTSPHPHPPDHEAGDDDSASTLIEVPLPPGHKPVPHDFPDGGGSGGAEAYRRKKTER